MSSKWNIEKIKEILDRVGLCKILSVEYINNKVPLVFECPCGETFTSRWDKMKSTGIMECNECRLEKRRNVEFTAIKEFIYNEVNEDIQLITDTYINNKTPMTFRCECRDTFETTWNSFKNSGKRLCNKCSKIKQAESPRKSDYEFKNEVYNMYNGEYEFLDVYDGALTNIKVKHINCGNVYSVNPHNFLRGSSCPKCRKKNVTANLLTKTCSFCGEDSENLQYGRYEGVEYCSRHLQQARIHGKPQDRTRRDGNTFRVFNDDNLVEIDMRNKIGEVVAVCLVDTEDFEKFSDFKWSFNGKCHKSSGYVISRSKGRDAKILHRLIMNAEDGQIVDHINGNTLDNRRSNLRFVDNSQSGMNKGLQSNNTSGQKGVHFNTQKQKWCANIGYYGKSIYLGCHSSLEDAIEVRRNAENKYFGEFNRRDVCDKNSSGS